MLGIVGGIGEQDEPMISHRERQMLITEMQVRGYPDTRLQRGHESARGQWQQRSAACAGGSRKEGREVGVLGAQLRRLSPFFPPSLHFFFLILYVL